MAMTKREFRKGVFDIMMDVLKQNIETGKGKQPPNMTVSITTKRWNIYFKLKEYGGSLEVLLFMDGNIVIRKREYMYHDLEEVYYEYDETDDHKVLLKQVRKDLRKVVKDYFKVHHYDYEIPQLK